MSNFTSSFSQLADLRSAATRRLALALVSTAALSAALLLPAAPAGALVKSVPIAGGGTVSVGLQPREAATVFYGPLQEDSLGEGVFEAKPEPESFQNATGGPVLPASNTYAIYWDPTDHYHGDWQHVIDTFFQSMGAASGSLASVFAVDAQYTDAANQHALYKSTFQGAYTDTDPYPTVGTCSDPAPLKGESQPDKEPDAITCLTDKQIRSELETFISDHGLQKGMSTIFYLLTPPGVTVCLDAGASTGHCSDYHKAIFVGGETKTEKEAKEKEEKESYEHSFCSYHSDISPTNEVVGDERTILYGVIPWIAGGLADGHLAPVDQTATEAYKCQDGGFNPNSEPFEKKETVTEKSAEALLKEDEELIKKEEAKEKLEEEGNAEAVKALERAEKKEDEEKEKAEILTGPHQQEPNQQTCPPRTPDGYCDTGLADLIINQIAVEQQNIVTDPLLNGWKDQIDNEATDECRNYFAPVLGGSFSASPETSAGTLFNQSLHGGSYYLNDAFNLAAQKLPYPGISCLPGIRLEPQFTAPNPVNANELVSFNGMESDITLNWGTAYSGSYLSPSPKPTYATYKWNFGDGSPEVTGFAPGAPSLNSPETSPCAAPWLTPCAASTFHSYQYGGTYNVTLTVTDTGGNTATFTEPITVNGPSAPSSAGGGSPAGGSPATASTSSSSSSTPGSSGSGTPAKPPVPGPVASQAALSHSLSSALSKGLVVSYSVNEQVAGQFQVLLADSVARRIGLHGAPATGLAPGSPPSIVIAKAILITTKGGRNTVKILFGKKTAAKLRKLRKVSLTIRLVVRNASSHNPISTTVISTVNLYR